jgi:predicted nucleotidyltransferase
VGQKGKSEVEISTMGELVGYLRNKKPLFREKFGVTRIGVFGSFAQGRQTVESDIDLVVEFEESKKNIHKDKPNLYGRLLTTYGWYRLLKLIPIKRLKEEALSETVIGRLFPNELRERYEYAGKVLSE